MFNSRSAFGSFTMALSLVCLSSQVSLAQAFTPGMRETPLFFAFSPL